MAASKYVLWRVANGWLMTYSSTIWEDSDHMSRYAVFHTLKEFSDWVGTKKSIQEQMADPKPQTPPRNHGKFAAKSNNRIKEHAGRTAARR